MYAEEYKKKEKFKLEVEIFKFIEKNLKIAMDKALDDIFKDWK